MIKVINESESKEIRRSALKLIKITPSNVNKIIYRIKDRDENVRKLLLERLITSEVDFIDIEVNGFCFLIGFCELMKINQMELLLFQFLLKQTDDQELKIQRIFDLHTKIDL